MFKNKSPFGKRTLRHHYHKARPWLKAIGYAFPSAFIVAVGANYLSTHQDNARNAVSNIAHDAKSYLKDFGSNVTVTDGLGAACGFGTAAGGQQSPDGCGETNAAAGQKAQAKQSESAAETPSLPPLSGMGAGGPL